MDATDVTEVCRLCPSSRGRELLNVFDTTIPFKYNMTEVILMNTGIEILENDLVSKKICQRCCNILSRMYEFRLDALKQNQELKEKCAQYLRDRGIRLPNTCITIKKESTDSTLTSKKIKTEPDKAQPSPQAAEDLKKRLHPSVANIFRNHPNFKLPKKCFERHMAPVVSLTMDEVETYFKKQKLNMKKFIYKPSTKTDEPRKVAKKRTSFPTKQKTVAPLKINLKLLEDSKETVKSTEKLNVCPSEAKELKGRKRKISSSSDRSVESTSSRNNQFKSVSKANSETSNATINENTIETMQPAGNLSNTASGPSRLNRTPSPAPNDPLSKNSRTASPAPNHPISEKSRDSCSTNITVARSPSTEQPQFMESFGLTPTVTTTKSHTLVVCNLCGSVHNNAFELKRHTNQHMVCQFCKFKFKSVEAKQNHVDKSCQIKKLMNSPGTVKLEKIHLDLDIRKKYRDAFSGFETIPGLVEPTPVEQVILKAASPPPSNHENAVIVLSDDEDGTPAILPDPLSGIPTPSAHMLPPEFENAVYGTVSIVRPDIRIKNNTLLNSFVENMSDKQLMKDLIIFFKPPHPTTTEAMVQTDLPASKDIQVNNPEGTCEFRNLKGQLTTYKVPITISHGPFQVSYGYKNHSSTNTSLDVWDHLPVIDVKKTTPILPEKNTNIYASKSSLSETTRPQSNAVVSPGPVLTIGTINPGVSSTSLPVGITNNSGLVDQQSSVLTRPLEISNSVIPVLNNSSVIPINSATPLLQNYALSMTPAPIISNPIPIPRAYINSALNNAASTSHRAMSSTNGQSLGHRSPSVTPSFNRSMPTSTLEVSRPNNMLVTNSPGPLNNLTFSNALNSSSNSIVTDNSLVTPTDVHVNQTNNSGTQSGLSSNSVPPAAETPTFRVRSVWELQ